MSIVKLAFIKEKALYFEIVTIKIDDDALMVILFFIYQKQLVFLLLKYLN